MALKKLTLSAPEEVITEAKRIAAENTTSISALFARLFRATDPGFDPKATHGPITRRATGLVRLPSDQTDQDLLENALNDKYGISQ